MLGFSLIWRPWISDLNLQIILEWQKYLGCIKILWPFIVKAVILVELVPDLEQKTQIDTGDLILGNNSK